jgi:hypothetical protein
MALTPAERVRRWRAKKKLQQLQQEPSASRTGSGSQSPQKESEVVIEKIISTLRLRSYLPTPIDWKDYNSSNYLIIF